MRQSRNNCNVNKALEALNTLAAKEQLRVNKVLGVLPEDMNDGVFYESIQNENDSFEIYEKQQEEIQDAIDKQLSYPEGSNADLVNSDEKEHEHEEDFQLNI